METRYKKAIEFIDIKFPQSNLDDKIFNDMNEWSLTFNFEIFQRKRLSPAIVLNSLERHHYISLSYHNTLRKFDIDRSFSLHPCLS